MYLLGVAEYALYLAKTSVREEGAPEYNISEGPHLQGGARPHPGWPEFDHAPWAPYLPYVSPGPATLQPQNSVAATEIF